MGNNSKILTEQYIDSVKTKKIEQVIRDMHFDLDMRKNGEIAQNNAITRIEEILNLFWIPGQEKRTRGE